MTAAADAKERSRAYFGARAGHERAIRELVDSRELHGPLSAEHAAARELEERALAARGAALAEQIGERADR